MMQPAHPSDGSDALGHELDVVIRIGPDGRVYVHDITEDLLPLLVAMNPDDAVMQKRAQAVLLMKKGLAT